MTEKEFNELVYLYGANGTKEIETLDEKKQQAIIECWSDLQSELDYMTQEESDAFIDARYKDTLYFINFFGLDSRGYIGFSGTVGFDGKPTTNDDNFMYFASVKEAENWIELHREEFAWNTQFEIV